MFLENIKQTYLKNKSKNPLLLRNILKETIQFYVINYIFGSVWGSRLIMKGGTCLRFCFDLPRLSEDLDFDIEGPLIFDINKFANDLENYFVKTLKFAGIQVKPANNKRTIYLKFPVLADLGFPVKESQTNTIHVRIDLAPAPSVNYKAEISIKSVSDFSFLIRRYSLPDLFAGKLCAILTRETFEGMEIAERFKGRDYFDLIWFLEKGVLPNWEYVEKITKLTKKQAVQKLKEKAKKATSSLLKDDLLPFFENIGFVETFSKNFPVLLKQYLVH